MTAAYDHSLRRSLSDLLHERSLAVYASPVALRSWVLLVPDAARRDEEAHVCRFGASPDMAAHGRFAPEGAQRVWERHGEFSTYLRFTYAVKDGDDLFGHFRSQDFDWLQDAPGKRFRSVEIVVRPDEPSPETLTPWMDVERAVCCDVFDGMARIWSDFRLHEDAGGGGGAGRIYVHDKGLRNDELSRLLQSLLEIGHYRKLALLGFPVARELFGWLKDADGRLEAITKEMTQTGFSQDHVLERLLSLSAEVEAKLNAVRFRQGATEAYYRLTLDRLQSLRETRVGGYSTMGEFIQRRLQPAMRTCEAATQRLDDLSLRISRVSDLLRAKVSISLERQNQGLLKSMNLRSKLQLQMQTLVEGLSVFAISYYVFGLVKYLIDPFIDRGHGHQWIYALTILIILGLVWGFIHWRKKTLTHAED